MTKVLFLLLFLLFACSAHTQTVTTISGNGTPSYTGDGGQASAATLNHPDVVKIDKAGNLFIADEFNHVIRRISTSGVITTVAGTGISGYTGDNGPDTAAKLSRPSDVTFDAIGNIYITELGNAVIRKIGLTGIITTIAGTGTNGYSGDNGPATAARLSDPLGLTFDNSGNLFFSDIGNRRVRKINTAGIITTIAGTGMAGYSGDGGPATAAAIRFGGYLTIGAAGELFIADYGNHVVRKIDHSGIINTIVGNGTNATTGDGGPATNAGLISVSGILVDHAGNMVLSDRLGYVLRMVNTSGIITTIAGTGFAGFSGDGGPARVATFDQDLFCSAADAAGNLYIADRYNHRIRKITNPATETNQLTPGVVKTAIYPNPAHNFIAISNINKTGRVSITNAIGQTVYSSRNCSSCEQVDISNLADGLYFVYVNGIYIGRFIKN